MAVEVLGVSKTFDPRSGPLFQGVQFQLCAGQSLAILGPSGSGKSTLLKILAGLEQPDGIISRVEALAPKVLIGGKSWAEVDSQNGTLGRSSVGIAFQRGALFDSLTASGNLTFVLERVVGIDHTSARECGLKLLKQVGLDHAAELFPAQLSGGMQKRLSVARALATDPKTVIYDDPIAGLDPITSRALLDMIRSLQMERGLTVVCSINDVARALQFADTVGFLLDGQWFGPYASSECAPLALSESIPAKVHAFLRGEAADAVP